MTEIFDSNFQQQLIENSAYNNQFSFCALKATRLFRAKPGEFIIREGETPVFLYYLVQGRAKLYTTMTNGHVVLNDIFTPPCFIGEMELLNAANEPHTVQAIETSYCLALPITAFREQLLHDTIFLRNLCILLSRKNYRNIVSFSRNQAFPLVNRLAAFILMTENNGFYSERHTLAAEYLGVTYRHLLYVFARLVKDGILIRQHHIYRIADREALSLLADEKACLHGAEQASL